MPIEIGLGGRANSCDCPDCETLPDDGGSGGPGINIGDCCPGVLIPRQLHITCVDNPIVSHAGCPWLGVSITLDYDDISGTWIGTHLGDVCGNGIIAGGDGTYTIRAVLTALSPVVSPPDFCWQLSVTVTSGEHFCYPYCGITNAVPSPTEPVFDCDPLDVTFEAELQTDGPTDFCQDCGCDVSFSGAVRWELTW